MNLWELTNVYALFARYGEKRPAGFVKRVLDRDGNVLEDHSTGAIRGSRSRRGSPPASRRSRARASA